MQVFQASITEKWMPQLWGWLAQQEIFMAWNGNGYSQSMGGEEWDLMMACGAKEIMEGQYGHAFSQLKKKRQGKWMMGYLGYDLKNELETLASDNHDELRFPDYYFFEPEILIKIKGDALRIYSFHDPEEIYDQISIFEIDKKQEFEISDFRLRMSHENYIHAVQRVRQHIQDGDVYEMNVCMEFWSQPAKMDPVPVWLAINSQNPVPFSSVFRMGEKYILSFSPERFMSIKNGLMRTQPMKGTIKRAKDRNEDLQRIETLRNDKKERSENIMIVDLMRNDLARSAVPGTVKLSELCEIYSFPNVHQMVSTVEAQKLPHLDPVDALAAAFPMGSMTGCPKIRAMELIELYEESKRGAYSGALGYFTPDGDADFSVLIRTLLYDVNQKYLSLHAGSAITWESDPQKEYEECLLKASSVVDVFNDVQKSLSQS